MKKKVCPNEWQASRLVLLEKPRTPEEQMVKYRPIGMSHKIIAKTYEWLMAE